MTPIVLVILLSIGSFQAAIPGRTQGASPAFEDNAQGLARLAEWASSRLGVPKFNQPPLKVCVVGSVPFKDPGPYIVKPIWESQPPVHQLEPYAATFHYVEVAPGKLTPPPRTMKQAMDICRKAGTQ